LKTFSFLHKTKSPKNKRKKSEDKKKGEKTRKIKEEGEGGGIR